MTIRLEPFLKPGDRVRCVASCDGRLTCGKEYEITRVRPKFVGVVDDRGDNAAGWIKGRFKPIVRVKMGRAVQ